MRARAIALAAIMVCSLFVAGVGADTDDDYVTDIGTGHDLADSSAISEFESDGATSADLTRLDMTVTVAESKSDVGIEDQLTPTDPLNDFLRVEYREETDRTVRILIPDDYWTPYERQNAESVTSDDVADLEPVRGGDYTAVTLRFDGPTDAVFPAEWVASFSYSSIERVDNRLNNSVGFQFRDDNSQWEYVDGDVMTDGPGYDIGEPVGDVTVQYDATPDSPEETWINAPEGETWSDDIYYYQRDSANSTAYIVSKTDDPPSVRYNVDSGFLDDRRGDINELKNIPNRIGDLFGGD